MGPGNHRARFGRCFIGWVFDRIEHFALRVNRRRPRALPGTFWLQAWVQAQIQPRPML